MFKLHFFSGWKVQFVISLLLFGSCLHRLLIPNTCIVDRKDSSTKICILLLFCCCSGSASASSNSEYYYLQWEDQIYTFSVFDESMHICNNVCKSSKTCWKKTLRVIQIAESPAVSKVLHTISQLIHVKNSKLY